LESNSERRYSSAVNLHPLSPLLAYGALALAALFWAGNMLTGSAVHARISPALLSVWRWLAILLPVYACLLGAIMLGDSLHLYHLIGFVLIVAGLGIAAASRQKA
jgi:hypothetical protein